MPSRNPALEYLQKKYKKQFDLSKVIEAMANEWVANKQPNHFEEVRNGKRVLKDEFKKSSNR